MDQTFVVPDNKSVTVGGSCNKDDQYMTIAFKPSDNSSEFVARFNFEENSSKERFANRLILDYTLDNELFPGTNETGARRTYYQDILHEFCVNF